MKPIIVFALLIFFFEGSSQELPREFEFENIIRFEDQKIGYINSNEQIIGFRIGVLYRIYSLKDSLIYEPSYPWHRKTLMVYHIKDYERLLKIDTNLVHFNKWINLKKTRKEGKSILHKYALPLDSLRYHNNAPDSIFVWVKYNSKIEDNWILQAFKLFKLFNGVPEYAKGKTIWIYI